MPIAHCAFPATSAYCLLPPQSLTLSPRRAQRDLQVRRRWLCPALRPRRPPCPPQKAPLVFVYSSQPPTQLRYPAQGRGVSGCRPQHSVPPGCCRGPPSAALPPSLAQHASRRCHLVDTRIEHDATVHSIAATCPPAQDASQATAPAGRLAHPDGRHGRLQHHPAQAHLYPP